MKRNCHPTGGRTIIHQLQRPFFDPIFELPCLEADAKGALLTPSGHALYKDELEGDSYQEIMPHAERKEAFGSESLEISLAEVSNLSQVRGRGILTPYPASVLKLRSVVVAGQKYSISEAKGKFGIPQEEEFSLTIRLWPGTSTRANDFFEWKNCARKSQPPGFEILLYQAKFKQVVISLKIHQHPVLDR